IISFLFYSYVPYLDLHSFPTRRSSDLGSNPGPAAGLVSRSSHVSPRERGCVPRPQDLAEKVARYCQRCRFPSRGRRAASHLCRRSEEHTSELQSRFDLVCRLLLEKKKK